MSSSRDGGKSLRLTFKGEKAVKKKKKRSSGTTDDANSSSTSRKKRRVREVGPDGEEISDVEDVGGNEQAWVPVQRVEDLVGPCFIYQTMAPTSSSHTPSDSSNAAATFCIALNPTLQSVEPVLIGIAANNSNNNNNFDDDEELVSQHHPGIPPEAEAERTRALLMAQNPQLALELEGAEIVTSVIPPSTLPSSSSSSSSREETLPTPESVYQVWVATQVPGGSSGSIVASSAASASGTQTQKREAKYTFKSAESKFMGSDKDGSVSALMDARGPQEEWLLEPLPTSSASRQQRTMTTMWTLRSIHGKYLGLDRMVTTTSSGRSKTKVVVRADATKDEMMEAADDPIITNACGWKILVQWQHRHRARYPHDPNSNPAIARANRVSNDPTVISTNSSNSSPGRSVGGSRTDLSREERKALKKAQKEGRLAEELLNQRTKLKSDRYA